MFKRGLTALALIFSVSTTYALDFPTEPEQSVTPGSLCENADEYRYPERIPYCERAVDPETKRAIIDNYDRRFDYNIGDMNRELFKIDHFIPLCMGGSNDVENLWPQHMSVYEVTDPLEELVCEKMAEGVLKQKRAVEYIREAKTNLDRAEAIYNEVYRL